MVSDDKRYSKLNMFVFLIFALLAIVFAVQMFKYVKLGTIRIESENRYFICENLNFKIEFLTYKDQSLVFQIDSYDYAVNLTKLSIIPDNPGEKKEIPLDPILKGGDSRIIKIEDITLNKSFNIYAEDCEKKGVSVKV